MSAARDDQGSIDWLTLVAIAVIAYAIANVAHEGLGHGGACVAVGGKPLELNAVFFDCDESGLGPAAGKWVSAGGTLVNFVIGAAAWLGFTRSAPAATSRRYFLWLLMTVSLLQGTGYWLFSGVGNLGDWAKVVEGLAPAWPWRVLLAAAGGAGYILTARLAVRSLGPMLGGGDDRVRRARGLMLVPYVAGGALYVAAGALNPASPVLILISGAAASFGGTSGLAWMYNLLHDRRRFPPADGAALAIPRSKGWIAAGAAVALVFVVVLGRSIHR